MLHRTVDEYTLQTPYISKGNQQTFFMPRQGSGLLSCRDQSYLMIRLSAITVPDPMVNPPCALVTPQLAV